MNKKTLRRIQKSKWRAKKQYIADRAEELIHGLFSSIRVEYYRMKIHRKFSSIAKRAASYGEPGASMYVKYGRNHDYRRAALKVIKDLLVRKYDAIWICYGHGDSFVCKNVKSVEQIDALFIPRSSGVSIGIRWNSIPEAQLNT